MFDLEYFNMEFTEFLRIQMINSIYWISEKSKNEYN